MNAVVGKSSDISHSLSYAQNHGKDGTILLTRVRDKERHETVESAA